MRKLTKKMVNGRSDRLKENTNTTLTYRVGILYNISYNSFCFWTTTIYFHRRFIDFATAITYLEIKMFQRSNRYINNNNHNHII